MMNVCQKFISSTFFETSIAPIHRAIIIIGLMDVHSANSIIYWHLTVTVLHTLLLYC